MRISCVDISLVYWWNIPIIGNSPFGGGGRGLMLLSNAVESGFDILSEDLNGSEIDFVKCGLLLATSNEHSIGSQWDDHLRRDWSVGVMNRLALLKFLIYYRFQSSCCIQGAYLARDYLHNRLRKDRSTHVTHESLRSKLQFEFLNLISAVPVAENFVINSAAELSTIEMISN